MKDSRGMRATLAADLNQAQRFRPGKLISSVIRHRYKNRAADDLKSMKYC